MPAKKRSATGARKRPRPSLEEDLQKQNNNVTTPKRKQQSNHRVSERALLQLKYAVPILLLAMIIGILWNKAESADPRMISFLSAICRQATCARFVIPSKRTLQAARPVRAGESLFEIPRSMQFWDIDALRDGFVRQNLLSARHAVTGNHLSSGAFLAAWIALKLNNNRIENEPARQAYLDLLPSEEESLHHPLLWDKGELKESLGGHSLNYAVVTAYRDMVASEYMALVKASDKKFAVVVTESEFRVARMNVLSRSFSPGAGAAIDEMDEEEIQLYQQHGMDFSEGCRAMVPILDMLNHHPNPNVGYCKLEPLILCYTLSPCDHVLPNR